MTIQATLIASIHLSLLTWIAPLDSHATTPSVDAQQQLTAKPDLRKHPHPSLDIEQPSLRSDDDNARISRSRQLISAAKTQTQWVERVQRHLSAFDPMDKELIIAMAMHYYGQHQHHKAFNWLEKAIAISNSHPEHNRSQTYLLHQMRTMSAQKLWFTAKMTHSTTPSNPDTTALSQAKLRTLLAAKEWYQFADETAQDTRLARQICQLTGGDDCR